MAKRNSKKVTKHEIVEIAYICNGKNPKCKGEPGCFYCKTTSWKGPCMHTLEPEYAKNGAIKVDPKQLPERFERWIYDNGESKQIRYYEKYEVE